MPHYQTPQSFLGVNRLPKAAGDLISALFPKDTLPTPGSVVGPRVPVPKAASKSLLEAFRPWGKHIEQAYPQMFGPSQVPAQPQSVGAVEQYRQLLLDLLQRK